VTDSTTHAGWSSSVRTSSAAPAFRGRNRCTERRRVSGRAAIVRAHGSLTQVPADGGTHRCREHPPPGRCCDE
jgi:hypothetical protein